MRTTIQKTELKRIYDIACSTWQPRILEYAKRNPFEDTVDFTEKEVQEMIKASTAEQLPVVKEVFNITNTWEDIDSVEKACSLLGEKDSEVKTLRIMQSVKLPRKVMAEQELAVIIKAVNEGRTADFDNDNKAKYYPWFYLGKKFSLFRMHSYYSSSNCPARLCLETREKCDFMVSKFEKLYKEYLN